MDDYINRGAALDIVKRTSGDYAAACVEIRRLPAADVAPVRHGHWIDCEDEYSSYVRCSECGDEFTCWEADCAHTNFCPECGARMDGEAQAGGRFVPSANENQT